jgi:hypothetical protein
VLLIDLPHAALYIILHTAGPRSRELCRAFLHLYGPLRRLTPRAVESPADLLSALTANGRHARLTSLDLSHVINVLSIDTLQALCAALPALQTLRLPSSRRAGAPSGFSLSLSSVAAATARLPALAALHAPFLAGAKSLPPPAAQPAQGWARLQSLTLPIAFTASSAAALAHCTALCRLRFEGRGHVDVAHVAPLAAQLPALAALELDGLGRIDGSAHLGGLTRLTALLLAGAVAEAGSSTGQLLHRVGALTRLRSLHLQLWWNGDWQTAQPGWLTALALLTSLRVDYDPLTGAGGVGDGAAQLGRAFDEVASSVPRLPALRELHMSDNAGVGAEHVSDAGSWLSAAAAARIASASGSLRLLHLGWLSLPAAMFTEVLPRLTGLTCLRLDSLYCGSMEFGWMSALTDLRELRYVPNSRHNGAGCTLPCELLAGLSNVDTLTLSRCPFVDEPYLARLCASMPQLRNLDLGYNSNMSGGLSALRRLTNLEVLGLEPEFSGSLLQQLFELSITTPLSLRRCYLGPQSFWSAGGPVEVARAVLGSHVEAVFAHWYQEWRAW